MIRRAGTYVCGLIIACHLAGFFIQADSALLEGKAVDVPGIGYVAFESGK